MIKKLLFYQGKNENQWQLFLRKEQGLSYLLYRGKFDYNSSEDIPMSPLSSVI